MQADIPSSALRSVGQIHISVKDYDRAKAFYRDVLGLEMLFEVTEQKMAFFDCGGVRIYLGVPSSPEYAANSFLYYRVDDIGAAYDRLLKAGVEFLHPPQAIHKAEDSELWMAGFRDSEGNFAQLMCETPTAG
jgi:predicted enzyme related to lactoylglutathione lyase